MSNQGRTAAIKELRREVGYGCPVCRSPFLTWHHFDPPGHVEQHWRAEGIIALCLGCHGSADYKGTEPGAYSTDELRALKKSPKSVEDVRAHFPSWQGKERVLVRIGGCYTEAPASIISINGIPQLTIERDESGLLLLSFELRNERNDVLVKMQENFFTAYPKNIHDMIVAPKSDAVKVWLSEGDLGLEFSFKRITRERLDELLAKDFQPALTKIEESKKMTWQRLKDSGMPPSLMEEIEPYLLGDVPSSTHTFEGMPDDIREMHLAQDKTGWAVKRWLRDSGFEDDDTIPFLISNN